jgi:hypothetical protein
MVQFRLCEVSSSSALAWISFAREMLEEVASDPQISIPGETLAVVNGHLDDWETQATLGPKLSLQVEVPADELEHLGHVFLQVSRYSVEKADRRGFDVSPPESDEFFAALSEAMIAALEYSGEESTAEFATGLRNDWPRTDRLLADGTMVPVSSRFEAAPSQDRQ